MKESSLNESGLDNAKTDDEETYGDSPYPAHHRVHHFDSIIDIKIFVGEEAILESYFRKLIPQLVQG